MILVYDTMDSPSLESAKIISDATFQVASEDELRDLLPNFDFCLKVTNLTILDDVSKYLKNDENVAFYYSDFIKDGLEYYHVPFPSIIKMYPLVVFNAAKFLEALPEQNPLDYLGTKYISKHIPRLLCKYE